MSVIQNQAYSSSTGKNVLASIRKSQQDLFTKMKRTPINFLSLFLYKSNKTKSFIKHVKFILKKVLLFADKNCKPADYYVYA